MKCGRKQMNYLSKPVLPTLHTPSKDVLHSKCISYSVLCGESWAPFEQMQMAVQKIRLAAVLNYIFRLFVMLDFKRLSAVDSTRVPQLSGLQSTALMGWLSSVTELNCYQLFIIHPITSISSPVCDLPTTGGLFIRFSSMETYILIECLSSAKAFLQCPSQTDFPHFISHSVISDISCSALTHCQGVITYS